MSAISSGGRRLRLRPAVRDLELDQLPGQRGVAAVLDEAPDDRQHPVLERRLGVLELALHLVEQDGQPVDPRAGDLLRRRLRQLADEVAPLAVVPGRNPLAEVFAQELVAVGVQPGVEILALGRELVLLPVHRDADVPVEGRQADVGVDRVGVVEALALGRALLPGHQVGVDHLLDVVAELLRQAVLVEQRVADHRARLRVDGPVQVELVVEAGQLVRPRRRQVVVQPEAVLVDDPLAVRPGQDLAVEALGDVVQRRAVADHQVVGALAPAERARERPHPRDVVVGVVAP